MPYRDDAKTSIFSSLEIRTKPDGFWKRIDYISYGDSIIDVCALGQIIIFSDGEVGVFGFGKGYYFSDDSGETWHFWSPYRDLENLLGKAELWSTKSQNITLQGRGEWVISVFARDKTKMYVEVKRYTFSSRDKGLTWYLTKEEVPPPEE